MTANSKAKTKKKASRKAGGVSRSEFNEFKDEVKGSLSSLADNMSHLVEAVNASDRPARSTRDTIDTRDAEGFGQDHERVMRSTGPAEESLDRPQVEVVDGPLNPEWAHEMRFMEDELLITVHESDDPNAEPFPHVTVNGRNQYFIRGQEQRVKRKFVERLLRMKKTRYSQRKEKDANDNETYVNIPHTVLALPFAIIEDPAGPRGRDWYERLRREP